MVLLTPLSNTNGLPPLCPLADNAPLQQQQQQTIILTADCAIGEFMALFLKVECYLYEDFLFIFFTTHNMLTVAYCL